MVATTAIILHVDKSDGCQLKQLLDIPSPGTISKLGGEQDHFHYICEYELIHKYTFYVDINFI